MASTRRDSGANGNCPSCYELEITSGSLVCRNDHSFPLVRGVPRLLPEFNNADATSITQSFSREWRYFDYAEEARTWGQSAEERASDFLRFVDEPAESLRMTLVLDAGCGNGVLSRALTTSFGCEVLAADISESVEAAYHHFRRKGSEGTYFVRADLMNPAFRPGTFDFVFCGGVLHHTPDTYETFKKLVPSLAQGGKMFIWVYKSVPGPKMRVRNFLRRKIAPLPDPLKHAIVLTLIFPQSIVRQYLRTVLRRNEPSDRLRWRERLIMLLDQYTPLYRWVHTESEVHDWFRAVGFANPQTTEDGEFGFGVVAEKPALTSSAPARTLTSV